MNTKNSGEKTIDNYLEKPAFTGPEIEFFRQLIIDCREYLEFGVGGSTVFVYNNSHAKIYGVDSSLQWISQVEQNILYEKTHFVERLFTKKRFKLKPIDTGTLSLKHIDIGTLSKWGKPSDSTKRDHWPEYSRAIFKIAKRPDVILIDGRFRVACVAQVVLFSIQKKIRPKILLHDCVRKEYKKIYDILTPVSIVKSDLLNEKGLQLFEINPNIDVGFVEKIYEEFKFEIW